MVARSFTRWATLSQIDRVVGDDKETADRMRAYLQQIDDLPETRYYDGPGKQA